MNSTSQQEPCLQISIQYDQFTNANATEFSVDGKLAADCLLSMPFDARNGSQFVGEFRKFIEWQSTLDVLRSPPPEYLSPATDILGGLDLIQANAARGGYSSQYEFDSTVTTLLQTANVDHFSAQLCSLSIFSFLVDLELVSISIPQIYLANDAHLLSEGKAAVSPVATINGQFAVDMLEQLSSSQPFQDPDARYNQLLYWPSRMVVGQEPLGAFSTSTLWPERKQYDIQFANGSSIQKDIIAKLASPDDGFDYPTGRSLLEGKCLVGTSSTSISPSSSATPRPDPSVYPEPELRDDYNLISGYYLDEEDLQDVAGLFIPTFETDSTETEPADFANLATQFVNDAINAGKTKIIIDLSLNLGGIVNSGYDLFRLFFPSQSIYAASRFRATEQANLTGTALASLNPTNNATNQEACSNSLDWCLASWSEVFGPVDQFGGNMSALVSPQDMNTQSRPELPIRDYGSVAQTPTTAPFTPENILLITDGSCTSTCTTFAELTKNLGHVKSIVFGGRPHPGPMQAIGGSKGSQSLGLDGIVSIGQTAMQYAPTEEIRSRLDQAFPNYDRLPFSVSGTNLNFKSAYRPGEDVVPLQFVYEKADCRRFYTFENVVRPASIWVDAARTVWGGTGCVGGEI
ncbi:hypothetical protein BO71DRAFT_444721 [Aspergillus ellipticus CBS 707.79]|uniref:Uncharacterized protein n=1 Tax=Aspergillus ellipticus CBS 707.79 TaxID=1448320 RepID=A0A319CVA8_9EURO|nr:hypothetical protein BO71DRAFT_444721 [Aspergillus ellipticus CBS 707.79]